MLHCSKHTCSAVYHLVNSTEHLYHKQMHEQGIKCEQKYKYCSVIVLWLCYWLTDCFEIWCKQFSGLGVFRKPYQSTDHFQCNMSYCHTYYHQMHGSVISEPCDVVDCKKCEEGERGTCKKCVKKMVPTGDGSKCEGKLWRTPLLLDKMAEKLQTITLHAFSLTHWPPGDLTTISNQ